jgi:EAL domain-containing protein (putative c-di-GMP-specific phosphodiesterase class I)
VQGFYFNSPVPAEEFTALLTRRIVAEPDESGAG